MLPVVSLLFSLRQLRAPWAFSKAKAHGHPDGPAASHSCVLNRTLAGPTCSVRHGRSGLLAAPEPPEENPWVSPQTQSPDLEPQRCVVKAPQGILMCSLGRGPLSRVVPLSPDVETGPCKVRCLASPVACSGSSGWVLSSPNEPSPQVRPFHAVVPDIRALSPPGGHGDTGGGRTWVS